MCRICAGFLLTVALLVLGVPASAQQGQLIPHGQSAPPGPALAPEEAVRKMTVPEGFRVEVVASEPDLVNPVAMTFDERGRIWVTESLEYPRREPGPGRDRVKVLEDTDGDGKVDRVRLFADGLNIPSGIAVGHGGVWVANAPDILFYPDADRDGRPDGPVQVVVTGFGRDDTHELPNSLTWGPDGWLYGWNGVFNKSHVVHRGQTFDFTCAIFRIHPRTRAFEVFCEGTSNPWGLALNEHGDFFASACVIDHLWHLVEGAYYIRQGGPYPPFTWPMGSIVQHTHQKAAYCGIHYFDSPAYPVEYRGKLYMGNIHGNCINVDTLTRHGSTYQGNAAPDFLSAHDAWFMPVSQKTGPDGSLYILDWYDRYHCYQDANRDPAGIDRLKGRLYRVRYQETPRRVGFDLARESDASLIQYLGSPNVYDRDIAQRLLTERLAAQPGGSDLRTRLQALTLDRAADRKAGMHGLWALIGSGPLEPEHHRALLRHDDPDFRAWGVRAAGNQGAVEPALQAQVTGLARDPSPQVRLQVAIAAPKLVGDDAASRVVPKLFGLWSSSGDDRLLTHVVWQRLQPSLSDPATAAQLTGWARQANLAAAPAFAAVWPRLLDRVLAVPEVEGTTLADLARYGLQNEVATGTQRAILDTLTRAIREGRLTGSRLADLRTGLASLVDPRSVDSRDPSHLEFTRLAGAWGDGAARSRLRAILTDPVAAAATRTAALDVLISARDPALINALGTILTDRAASAEFRGQVLTALGPLDDPKVGPLVVSAFDSLEPALQPRAIELLTQRPSWSGTLMAAVEAKSIPASAVNVNQLRRLQSLKDPALAARVKTLWGTVREGRNRQREQVVAQMRQFLGQTPGDPFEGRQVFQKLCAQCHKLHGEGQEVGPDITLNGRNDLEQLLSNVFDPSLVIGAGFQATTVATTDGRVLTGLLVEDAPSGIQLKTQGGKVEAIPRAEVEEVQVQGISLMPEDLEKQLQPREIADLFAFLGLDKPPTDPTAKRLPGLPEPKPRR